MIANKNKKILQATALLLWLSACFQPLTSYPLPEPKYRQLMDLEVADIIANGCDRLKLSQEKRKSLNELKVSLAKSGMSADEIDDAIDEERDTRGKVYIEAYFDVIPVDESPDYYCEVGDYEIERRSAVGRLLTSS